MSMILPRSTNGKRPDIVSSAFAAIEFELALDLADTGREPFEIAVTRAADSVGAEVLFVMPPHEHGEEIAKVAAVRLPEDGGPIGEAALVFAVQETGPEKRVRLAGREEMGDTFYGFAKTYARLMERLDVPGSAEGSGPAA